MCSTRLVLATSFAFMAAATRADENPWPDRAVIDLHYIHDAVAANHPGPVLDYEFAAKMNSALAAALDDVDQVDNVSAYIYLLLSYINAMPDNHLEIWGAREHPEWATAPRPQTLYPGFVTAYRNGEYIVRAATRSGGAQDGMALVGCDDHSAAELAAANIFRFFGNAGQPADPARFAPLLFIDQGAPGVLRPDICTFAVDDVTLETGLIWRPIAMRYLGAAIQNATFGEPPAFGPRNLPDGGLWLSLPTFVQGQAPADAVNTVLATLRGTAAPYVVFDLRGNSGGSSFFADTFAAALLGDGWVQAQRAATSTAGRVDYLRASPDNRAYFADAADESGLGAQFDPGTRAYFQALVFAVDTARAAGQPLAELGGSISEPNGSESMPEPGYDGRVFVLTDGSAFSSALLFIDLVLRFPDAIHVGWPTRAHGLYGEQRRALLPSGWAWFAYSTKAFTSRGPGADAAYVPEMHWTGEIANTAALEGWIGSIAQTDQ